MVRKVFHFLMYSFYAFNNDINPRHTKAFKQIYDKYVVCEKNLRVIVEYEIIQRNPQLPFIFWE